MYELSVTGDFSSAHFLRGYNGPCENLHGHTWKFEVTIVSRDLNELGLVVDFRDIKDKLKSFIGHLDHVSINDLPAFREVNPSTENLARYIFEEFSKQCQPYRLIKVRVWESDTSSVTYYPDA